MTQHILIIGGGVGGTIVANLLARTLHPQEAEITLIDSSGKHVYMPLWLTMPFNQLEAEDEQLVRNERDLLNKHVYLVQGQVQRIDAANHEVHVLRREPGTPASGTVQMVDVTYPYDYLVLATGARLAPEELAVH